MTSVRRYRGTTWLDGWDEFVLDDVREDGRLDDDEVVAVRLAFGVADVFSGPQQCRGVDGAIFSGRVSTARNVRSVSTTAAWSVVAVRRPPA